MQIGCFEFEVWNIFKLLEGIVNSVTHNSLGETGETRKVGW